jgi:hypothetical protein
MPCDLCDPQRQPIYIPTAAALVVMYKNRHTLHFMLICGMKNSTPLPWKQMLVCPTVVQWPWPLWLPTPSRDLETVVPVSPIRCCPRAAAPTPDVRLWCSCRQSRNCDVVVHGYRTQRISTQMRQSQAESGPGDWRQFATSRIQSCNIRVN